MFCFLFVLPSQENKGFEATCTVLPQQLAAISETSETLFPSILPTDHSQHWGKKREKFLSISCCSIEKRRKSLLNMAGTVYGTAVFFSQTVRINA